MNLPDYNFISAPLWLITVLHILTLTLHFVAMNFMVGGIIIVLFGKLEDKWNHPVVRKFISLFPTAMAATITLGVAPLLFVQLVYHRQVYSASIVSGWFWLFIIVFVMIAYYFLYAASFSSGAKSSRTRAYLLVALLGLLYVGFVYSSVFSLAEKPDAIQSAYAADQSGFTLNPDIGSYIVRWLHMMLGAVTVGGFFVGLLGKDNDTAFRLGRQFYLWGMVAAMVIGFVYLITLSDIMTPFMKSPAAWWLVVSIVLSLGSLHFFFKKKFLLSGAMLFVSMIGMVAIRHIVRLIYLGASFEPSTIPVKPQWSIFIVFLICFVIALAVVAYMLRLFFAERKGTAT